MFFGNEGKHSLKKKKEDISDVEAEEKEVSEEGVLDEDVEEIREDVLDEETKEEPSEKPAAEEEDSDLDLDSNLDLDLDSDLELYKDLDLDLDLDTDPDLYQKFGAAEDAHEGAHEGMQEDEQDLKAQPMVGGIIDHAAAAIGDELLGVEQTVPVALAPSKNRHILVRVVGIIVIVLLVAIVISGIALYVLDSNRIKYVPENTTLDNKINISHDTREQLKEEISTYFTDTSNTMEVSVDFVGDVRQINLKNTAEIDTDAMVDAAFEPYNKTIVERMIDNVEEMVTGNIPARNVSIMIKPLTDKIKAEIDAIAEEINTDATDATYEYDKSENDLVAVPAQDGKSVNVDQTVSNIEDAIQKGNTKDTVAASVDVTKPENTEFGQAIYVDTSACVLHFYQDGQETNKYPCTPGMSGYSTPKGDWTLSAKDPSPTWYNPHSSWSESMPETIGPGASNPLGLRSLALSCGGGIYIHGTTNTSQLGTRASHGCIRLANAKIVELYDIVNVGIPIFVR